MIANLDLMHVCDSHGSFESSCALQESAALSCRILLPNLSFGLLARMIERVLSLSTILSLSLLTQKSHQTTHASGTACDHLFHYKVTTARDLMSTLSLRFLYQLRLIGNLSLSLSVPDCELPLPKLWSALLFVLGILP